MHRVVWGKLQISWRTQTGGAQEKYVVRTEAKAVELGDVSWSLSSVTRFVKLGK